MLRMLAAAALVAAPTSGLVSWPAPTNSMALTRSAGLVPEVNEHLAYHVHSHLDIFISGKRVRVPAGIGIDVADPAVKRFPMPDGSTAYGGIIRCPRVCISPLHTHDDTGVLHTETTKPVPNVLGQLFVEWHVRLTRTCVGSHCKRVLFYVNGHRYRGDPRKILLADLTEIAVVIGSPPKKIPAAFPRQ